MVARDELEAELICGFLRAEGIECGYRDTEAIDSAFEEFAASGPREVLVREPDLDAARDVIARANS